MTHPNWTDPPDPPAPPGPVSPDATETLKACPACASDEARFFVWGKSLYSDYWYAYWKCLPCDLVFLNPRAPARGYEANIEQEGRQRQVFVTKTPFDRPECRHNIVAPTRRKMSPAGPAGPRRWLDVGCAVGNLLLEVEAAGYEPHGLELNQAMAQWAAEHRPQLHIRQGLLSDLPAADQFDVISADNVLEHIHQPMDFLMQVRDHLVEDGLFVVRVPNLYNFAHPWLALAGKLPHSFFIDPDAHPVNYSRRPLENLLQRGGFKVERIMEHLMFSYPLKHILPRRTESWPEPRRQKLLSAYKALFPLDRLIPKGGIDLTILARKV